MKYTYHPLSIQLLWCAELRVTLVWLTGRHRRFVVRNAQQRRVAARRDIRATIVGLTEWLAVIRLADIRIAVVPLLKCRNELLAGTRHRLGRENAGQRRGQHIANR